MTVTSTRNSTWCLENMQWSKRKTHFKNHVLVSEFILTFSKTHLPVANCFASSSFSPFLQGAALWIGLVQFTCFLFPKSNIPSFVNYPSYEMDGAAVQSAGQDLACVFLKD